MRSSPATVMVLVAVALAGCTFSEVDPDADVTLRGAAEQPDGSALADALVGLDISFGPSVLVAVPAIIATFGQVCRTAICGAEHTTQTDPDGAYVFDLTGSDVQGLLGEELFLNVGVTGPRTGDALAGPSASVGLAVRDEQVQLPTLRLWAPAVTIESSEVVWESLPAERGSPEQTHAVFESLEGDQVWRGPATPNGGTVDPRVLEDTTGGVAALVTLPATGPDGVRRLHLRSGTHGYVSDAGAPMTRGAACEIITGMESSTVQPCALTDGDFGSTLPIGVTTAVDDCPETTGSADCQPDQSRLRIDVGGNTDVVELVVLRGCQECQVTVGDRSFATEQQFEAFTVGAAANEVTVEGRLDQLTEVSVWKGPGDGGLRPIDRAAAVEATTTAPDSAPDDSPAAIEQGDNGGGLAVTLVAVVLLAAAAVALVVARRRG